MNNVIFENDNMTVSIDRRRGVLRSLRMKGDPFGTECIGSEDNISYQSIVEMNQWIGDLKFRVWDNLTDSWTLELTRRSGDIRRVSLDKGDKSVRVEYPGHSHKERGIKNLSVTECFHMDQTALSWQICVKNISDAPLEIGEISLPFVTNTDFTGIFEDRAYESLERWRGLKQKLWHEQRVQRHLSINGSSSYALLQRPRGDYPALLFQTVSGTGLEAAYQMDPSIGCQWECTFEGPYYLSLYSKAARKEGRWKWETEQQAYWLNGNRSLMLEAGEEKQFHFAFRVLHEENELWQSQIEAGQVAVDVQPGMAAPVGETVMMRLRCRDQVTLLPVANNLSLEKTKENVEESFWKLTFTQPGQKKIQVKHGDGRTNLFFYATGPVGQLLDHRAEFIVNRQYYDNPQDPFGRHHAFLPYDDALEMLFTESEESWQVGGLDEYALPVAMYLAEMNSIRPVKGQIDILEEYIEDSLYGVLQERETYLARRGMYYEERTPSDIYAGNKWDKETAESTLRSFNYPLIIDIYFAMYKIAKKYGMTSRRGAGEYLEMAFRTAMVGYELGRNKFNGAPAGATIIGLLEALEGENREWYDALSARVGAIARENAHGDYPFGSELYVDQTAHNQYQAMMRYFGYERQLEEAYRVTYALRSGWQPAWFLYGNEKRGNVCCWYGTPLNSRVLFDGFERTGNLHLLKLGYAGLSSFLTCIRTNGAAHGWFLWWPDRTGFDWRSLDTDMGMYGYLRSAKAYLVDDPIFGRCGYGCAVEGRDGRWTARPYDGLGIRFAAVPYSLDVEVIAGALETVEIDENRRTCVLHMAGCAEGDVKEEERRSLARCRCAAGWTVSAEGAKVVMEQENGGAEVVRNG